MQVDVLNSTGAKTGRSLELPDDIFNIEPNDHCIYLAVKQYRAAQRQGTAKVKGRSEVKGSSKKLVRQKGTGGARKGNLRNPLYKGGGAVHGPQPRDYSIKLNRKVKDLAKMSALTYKARENKLFVVEMPTMDAPKTKTFSSMIQALAPDARRTLVVTAEYDMNVHLSGRNLSNSMTVPATDMNTYDIMNASALIFSEDAAKLFSEAAAEIASAE